MRATAAEAARWLLEVRHGGRRLARVPWLSALIVAVLGIGIGATTSAVAVVRALLSPETGIEAPARVVNIYHSPLIVGIRLSTVALSYPDYEALRAQQTSFEGMTAWAPFRATVVVPEFSQATFGEVVDGDYFRVLGIRPALGRLFGEAEAAQDVRAAVISHGMWMSRFGGDRAVLGRVVRVNGMPFEIIGVADERFRGVSLGALAPTTVWIPLTAGTLSLARAPSLTDREGRSWWVKARLRPGRTVDEATAEVAIIARRLDGAFPLGVSLRRRDARRPETSRQWQTLALPSLRVHESLHQVAAPVAALAMSAVLAVLIVACSVVVSLMSSFGIERADELRVRRMLGGSTWDLCRTQIAPVILLAGGGAGLGVLFAGLALQALAASGIRLAPGLHLDLRAGVDAVVLGVASLVAVASVLWCGVAPALVVSRRLQGGEARTGGVVRIPLRATWRRTAIVVQTAISVALVSTATIAAVQVHRLTGEALANGLDGVAMASVDLAGAYAGAPQSQAAVRSILASIRLQPGFQGVGFATALPTRPSATARVFLDTEADGRARPPIDVDLVSTAGAAVDVMGLRLRQGRDFRETDGPGAEAVAILSARAAQALFGREEVVGRSLTVRAPQYERADRIAPGAQAHERTVVVVGVCSDPIGVEQGRGVLLRPYAQHFLPNGIFAARTAGDVAGAAASLSSAIRRAEPDAGVIEAGAARDLALPSALGIRTTATLAGYLGVLTLFLTSLGFYGILAQLVSARTREIALRVTLGASRAAVRLLVARETVVPMVAGGVLGFAIARVVSTLLRFFYVRPEDHLDVRLALATMAVLGTIALAACWIPMRRALRIDVARALHEP